MIILTVGDKVLWLRTVGGGGGSSHAPSAKDPKKAEVVQIGPSRVRICVEDRPSSFQIQEHDAKAGWYEMATVRTFDDAKAHLADYDRMYPNKRHRITSMALTWVSPASLSKGHDIFQCQNCMRIWQQDQLGGIRHLFERVLPGDEMPGGECPVCRALCARWHPYVDEVVSLVSRMRAFDKKCSDEEYTELGDIWDLFTEARTMLQRFQRQPGFRRAPIEVED